MQVAAGMVSVVGNTTSVATYLHTIKLKQYIIRLQDSRRQA